MEHFLVSALVEAMRPLDHFAIWRCAWGGYDPEQQTAIESYDGGPIPYEDQGGLHVWSLAYSPTLI